MTRLRVLAGPSANELTPISHLVNTGKAHRISSPRFEGLVAIHIKGFVDEHGRERESAYFDEDAMGDRKGVTWSIQVEGRFLVDGLTADDVLFGNTFDRPLKLPWGSGAALKFMNLVDPTLEHALDSNKPWALSPLISTMPYFAISHPSHPPSFKEDSKPFREHLKDTTSALAPHGVPELKNPSSRRSYFANKVNRLRVPYDPSVVVNTDFCYGFLQFPEIQLNLPGGISFDLMKYWDRQPVRFVCCERKEAIDREGSDAGSIHSTGTSGSTNGKKDALKGPGEPFWVVVFEAVVDDHTEAEATGSLEEGESPPAPQAKMGKKERLEDQAHLREDID